MRGDSCGSCYYIIPYVDTGLPFPLPLLFRPLGYCCVNVLATLTSPPPSQTNFDGERKARSSRTCLKMRFERHISAETLPARAAAAEADQLLHIFIRITAFTLKSLHRAAFMHRSKNQLLNGAQMQQPRDP